MGIQYYQIVEFDQTLHHKQHKVVTEKLQQKKTNEINIFTKSKVNIFSQLRNKEERQVALPSRGDTAKDLKQ